MTHRIWVNDERTVYFRMWENGVVEMATRKHPGETWNPPIKLTEERYPEPKPRKAE